MKKKILKVFTIVFASLCIFLSFALTSFGAVHDGFERFEPNMPDMNLLYVSEGYTFPNWRTLTGYYQFGGSKNASQNAGDNKMSTFSRQERLGYDFSFFNKVEACLDFVYLPIKTQYNTAPSNTFYISFENLLGDMVSFDYVASVDLKFEVEWYSKDFTINSRAVTVTKRFEDLVYHDVQLNQLIPSVDLRDAIALKSIRFGFDVSANSYIRGISGSIMISNLQDWINYQPFKTATSNLKNSVYSYAYAKGATDSANADADAIYQSGYQAGYNAGSNFGLGANNSVSQATLQYYYDTGYQAGLATGNNNSANQLKEQYNSGYSSGYDIGYSDGLLKSSDDAYQQGKDEGYSLGLDAGYNQGYESGFDVGESNGYNDAMAERLEDVGIFEYIIVSVSSFLSIPLGEHFTLGGILALCVSIPILLACLKLFAGG